MNISREIPIVSIAHLSKYVHGDLPVEDLHKDEMIKSISDKLVKAFSEWGFVYLVDHSIQQAVIKDAFKSSKQFFTSSEHIKETFLRPNEGENWGWVPLRHETFDAERPFDLKECFNFARFTKRADDINKVVPTFQSSQNDLFDSCSQLSVFLLKLLTLALPTKDRNFLESKHRYVGTNSNVTITRLLHYPPIKSDEDILPNQLRCAEHSDYGTITLLFQDKVGGLQVIDPHGKYVNATPIPGSIVVNGGDLLEIWSSGKFKATKHRVVAESNSNTARQSLTFFLHPDSDVTVSPIDKSDQFPTVNALDYLIHKYDLTYNQS